MTSIGKSMFPLKSSFQHISGMKERYDSLQLQLATGQRHATLAQMGSDRFFDLTMRARLSRLDSYGETQKTVDMRLEVLDLSISRLDSIESTQRTSVTPGAYGTGNINFSSSPTVAYQRLDEVLTVLNADVGGRYLFGGGETSKKPVVSAQVAMDGEAGRAGFRTVMGERRQADLGASSLGRVAVTTATDTVTLTEDGAHPFGFKLATLSTSSANITLTQPTGTAPQSLAVEFGATLSAAGETVTLAFTLPDGTNEAITLTATTGTPAAGEFQIGADANATAANFATALTASLGTAAGTKLAAASSYAAAANFFDGQGQQVMRVDGPPFDSATALRPATAGDTVQWYTGEDSANARKTVNAKIDDNTTVNYGVQGNESGVLRLVQTLAAMAAQTYPTGDGTSGGRFDAMASRQINRLAESNSNSQGSIASIAVELGMSRTTIDYVKERQSAHKGQLEAMLADIETIPEEEVAMEILALKTRLEASYETTALVAQLSLVNYLP